MKANVGKIDRIIRAIAGVVFFTAAAVFYFGMQMMTPAIIAGVLGLVMFFTAATSFCLLYVPFNISTKK